MKEIEFHGSLTIFDSKQGSEINITLPRTNLKIKGVSRETLIRNKSILPEEHGVYILEADNACYVGQSQNLKNRLSGHFNNKKINFERVFFVSRPEDLRDKLDYMEKYLYKSMLDQGYELTNDKELDPETDALLSYKKATVQEWINEFLLFLPILGFKKVGQSIKNTARQNQLLPTEQENISTFKEGISPQKNPLKNEIIALLKEMSLIEIQKHPALQTNSIQIKEQPFRNMYKPFTPSKPITNKYNETFHISFYISNANLIAKIKQLKKMGEQKPSLQDTPLTANKITLLTNNEEGQPYKSTLRNEFVRLLKEMPFSKIQNHPALKTTAIQIQERPFNNMYKPFTPSKPITNKYNETFHIIFNISNEQLLLKVEQIKLTIE